MQIPETVVSGEARGKGVDMECEEYKKSARLLQIRTHINMYIHSNRNVYQKEDL